MVDTFDAESAILGALLMAGRDGLAQLDLEAKEFRHSELGRVYQVMLDLARTGPVDLVTVTEELGRREPQVQWLPHLSRMAREVVSLRNIGQYARIIRDAYQKRQAAFVAQELISTVAHDGMEAVDRALRELMALGSGGSDYEHDTASAVKHAYEYAEQAGKEPPITTGIHSLDATLGGLHPKHLTVVAARPSIGKTAFGLNLAMGCGGRVGFFSAEQPVEELGMRMLSREANLNYYRLLTGKVDPEQWGMLTQPLARLTEENRLMIYDRPGMSISDIIRYARKWHQRQRLQMVVVDYVQKIYGFNRRADLRIQVGEVVGALKDLAKELGIPVLALAQVNRKCEERNDRRPLVSDVKESGQIEQDADEILLLYREEVYFPNTIDKRGIMEVMIGKNRHGPTGRVELRWDSKTMTLTGKESS